MRELTELTDLIGNEELTTKYLVNERITKIREKFNFDYPAAEACIIDNTELELSKQTSDTIDWFREHYTLQSLLDIFPNGVLVPIEKQSGMIELNTVKGLMRYQYQCRPDVAVPLKKEDEVYLIFPYCMTANKVINEGDSNDTVKTYPIWDILVVPNFLLDEPKDSPLYC